MKKLLFIYNPKSGKGQIRTHLADIIEKLSSMNLEISVHVTQGNQDASKFVLKYGKSFDLILCSGGDGTLSEVVSGVVGGSLRLPIGYIPTGNTNDFANTLNIPKQISASLDTLINGNLFPCDIGKINEEYFIYVAAFGAFTNVSYETKQDLKNILGHIAYILEGVKSLSSLKSWHLKFKSPEKSGAGEFIFGMITNSNSVGGFKSFTGQNISLNDGLFEVTFIRMPDSFIDWPGIINALLTGDANDYIIAFKTSELQIIFDKNVPWTRDGEFGGEHSNVCIRNLHQAVSFIVPKI